MSLVLHPEKRKFLSLVDLLCFHWKKHLCVPTLEEKTVTYMSPAACEDVNQDKKGTFIVEDIHIDFRVTTWIDKV